MTIARFTSNPTKGMALVMSIFYSILCFYFQINYALNGLVYLFFLLYPCGAVEIEESKNNVTFKVNGQRLKSYTEYQPYEEGAEIN